MGLKFVSDDKNEIAYYPEICMKMGRYLDDALGGLNRFGSSQNKLLNLMITEIHKNLGVDNPSIFYPPLKTDIAFGVEFPNGYISPMLLEVKRGRTLSLIDYSQLIGYLQVAKHIKVGLLMLVNEGADASQLSSDFKYLIDIQQLNFDWSMTDSVTGEVNVFRTGICVYTPGNGIDWINSKGGNGISSWETLIECLKPTPFN
jgi:hypothetical protein